MTSIRARVAQLERAAPAAATSESLQVFNHGATLVAGNLHERVAAAIAANSSRPATWAQVEMLADSGSA
jgi:hypothetical protein